MPDESMRKIVNSARSLKDRISSFIGEASEISPRTTSRAAPAPTRHSVHSEDVRSLSHLDSQGTTSPSNFASESTSAPSMPPASSFSSAKSPVPETLADFIDLVRRTPKSVLSATDRSRIAAIMSFDSRIVRDLMVPRREMIFVKESDVLGPVMLDKLYKSGYTSFPVIDVKHNVLGIIHTNGLNALEIKETDQASKYLDPNVHYLRARDSLKTAIAEIEHTHGYYFLVLDNADHLIGFFTIQMLLDYLLG